jgi:hypothetical protein
VKGLRTLLIPCSVGYISGHVHLSGGASRKFRGGPQVDRLRVALDGTSRSRSAATSGARPYAPNFEGG